jgi:hypothetical protein
MTRTDCRPLPVALLAGLLAVAPGCSGPSLTFTDTVEGTLTLDGAAVPDALVEFVPDVPAGTKAPHSSAVSDAKGFFRLTREDNQRPGALVGSHHVTVLAGRPAGGRDDADGQGAVLAVPKVYTSAARTPLVVEVSKDRKTYELRMTRSADVP